MRKPPKRLKILNLTYSVEFCSRTARESSGSDGWCDFDDLKIVIYSGLSDEAKADTFLHECIHAVAYAMGIDWRKEEQVSRRVATGLCTLWKANPGAFKWWYSLL